MKPYVGQVVHYVSYGTPGGEYPTTCRAAVITEVGQWVTVAVTKAESYAGHWRRQRVGKGRQEIRRTWVSSHVKGPEDRPLVVRDKLYDIR